MRGISWLPEDLLAFQEGLCSMVWALFLISGIWIKIASKSECINKQNLVKWIYMPVHLTDYVRVCASACVLAHALVVDLIGVRLYSFLCRILSKLLHSPTLCLNSFIAIHSSSSALHCYAIFYTPPCHVWVQVFPSLMKVMVVYGVFFHPSHG